MDADHSPDRAAAAIAAAIGEPARARMLYCLADNRARTATELAIVAEIGPSTASAHLSRLKAEGLVSIAAQGKHRYYSLAGPAVARILESLSVFAGSGRRTFVPNTPTALRAARTCYDHIAGALGVAIHDRFLALKWIAPVPGADNSYVATLLGRRCIGELGVRLDDADGSRRRFAYSCLDWSERRSHLGGWLASAILADFLKKRWIRHEFEGRALAITTTGAKELTRLGIAADCAREHCLLGQMAHAG